MGVEAAIAGVPSIRSGVYQHYRGGIYWVPGVVVIEEETGHYRVIYWSLKKRVWWARPFKQFTEFVQVEQTAIWRTLRFERIGGRGLWWVLRLRYALGGWEIPG